MRPRCPPPPHRPGTGRATGAGRRSTVPATLVTTVALLGPASCAAPEPPVGQDPGASSPESAGTAAQGADPGSTATGATTAPGSPSTAPPTTGPDTTGAPGTVPPPWLGTRVLPETAQGFGEIRPTPPQLRQRRFTLPDTVPPLPGTGFASRVTRPPPPRVLERSTWGPDCPVDRTELAYLRLTFHGFDDRRHTGELLVHADAADAMVAVFRDLYRARFPLEEVRVIRAEEVGAPPTGDGNTTTAFVCRAVTGGSSHSQHAYGLAVDVNPFQNPYVSGDPDRDGVLLPELASAYLDRDRGRPGVIRPGSPVVRAFAAVGWEWGGDWRSLTDYQHFSRTGR